MEELGGTVIHFKALGIRKQPQKQRQLGMFIIDVKLHAYIFLLSRILVEPLTKHPWGDVLRSENTHQYFYVHFTEKLYAVKRATHIFSVA